MRPHISLNVLVFGLLLLHHYLTSVHFPQSLYHENLDHQIGMDLNPSWSYINKYSLICSQGWSQGLNGISSLISIFPYFVGM